MQDTIHKSIDAHIGKRTEQRRCELDMSLETLSKQSGIPVTELHRLEAGKLRITAAQVFHLSYLLHVSVGFFFEKYHDANNKEINRLVSAFVHLCSTRRAEILRMLEESRNQPLN